MPPRSTTHPEDPAREERIIMEIVVDCYNEDERASGWYCYLEDRLDCPFAAVCISEHEASPLRKGEQVTVLKLLDQDDYSAGAFLAQIEWHGRKLGVPLAQIEAKDADPATTEALADWHYWIARGYCF
jgi:hypothetical protein